MTVLTLRRIREDRFEVTGPDIEPVTFKTRVEARDWCLTHYQGSPIREVGGRKKGTPAAAVATPASSPLKAKALRRGAEGTPRPAPIQLRRNAV